MSAPSLSLFHRFCTISQLHSEILSQNSQLCDLVRCGMQAFTVGIPHQIIQNVPNIHIKYYLDVGAFLVPLPQILYYLTTPLRIQSFVLLYDVAFSLSLSGFPHHIIGNKTATEADVRVFVFVLQSLYCNLCTAKCEK